VSEIPLHHIYQYDLLCPNGCICTYEYFMSTKISFTVLIVAELETPPGCRGVFAGFWIKTPSYGCLLVAWMSSLTLYRLILRTMCILFRDVQHVIHRNSRSLPSIRTHWMSRTWHCTYLDAIVKVRFTHCYLVRCLSHSSASSASSLVNLLFLSQNLLISLQDKSASTSDCANTGKILSFY